ncbi:hypothetical protein [Saccharothrix variisporea]|uniref:Uncharacterized protein n=1 Tax=Saccharothrix variisporea TaxID=543527 RepID=A0A495X905_9PSEU|nr:hypothetical protein [Saccharothrix variisporea]RKT70690.1 hypothetical protein DFJ66_3960 [Saccharothrix variisporea]
MGDLGEVKNEISGIVNGPVAQFGQVGDDVTINLEAPSPNREKVFEAYLKDREAVARKRRNGVVARSVGIPLVLLVLLVVLTAEVVHPFVVIFSALCALSLVKALWAYGRR